MDVTNLLARFAAWLGQTPAFEIAAGVAWVVPAVQTLHILAVSVVIGSAAVVDLRVLGVVERERPVSEVLARFLPATGWALGILAVTGSVLILSEPTRAIFRIVFWAKLALVILGAILTWTLAGGVRRRLLSEAPGPMPLDLKFGAALALTIWLAAIVAGRWIGYADAWPGAPL